MLSIQYLMTPLLDDYYKPDTAVAFRGVWSKVKAHLWSVLIVVHSIILWTLCSKVISLVKGEGQTACSSSQVLSASYLVAQLPELIQWLSLDSRYNPYWFSGYIVKVKLLALMLMSARYYLWKIFFTDINNIKKLWFKVNFFTPKDFQKSNHFLGLVSIQLSNFKYNLSFLYWSKRALSYPT